MPIYEYVCMECCNEFELMRPMSESDKLASCPKCRKPAQKQVSTFGSKTGFYVKVPEKGPFRKAPSKSAGNSARTGTQARKSAEKQSEPKSTKRPNRSKK